MSEGPNDMSVSAKHLGLVSILNAFSNRSEISQAPAKFQSYLMTSSNGNIARVTGHLCGEFTGPRWFSRTKAFDAELWFSLISVWIKEK